MPFILIDSSKIAEIIASNYKEIAVYWA